ncbi:hypothetical protein CBP05_02760 [Pseudomonas putida]|nr:hypothetical protein CBP05_02760 [Pseudomonas putida]OUS91289.1 hypothetical protein CBP06_01680 [Pseudomonas putida]PEI08897.1 hypothetical protein CRM86_13855 [Pseudomonas putida]
MIYWCRCGRSIAVERPTRALWEQLSCSISESWRDPCGSGLASRKGCTAAPGFQRRCKQCRGRFAALSRHKAAPTERGLLIHF